MKVLRKLLSAICVLAMLVSVFYIPAFATIEPGKIGAIDYYKQEWNGKEWLFSNMVRDASGTKEQMSFVNENGNMEMKTYNGMDHDRVHIQFPYSVNEDGTLSPYDTLGQLEFMDDSNFNVDFRMRYTGHVFFMVRWLHGAVRLEFKDNRITVDDGNGNRNSVSIVDDGKWHDYGIEVRGQKCPNSIEGPTCITHARVFMDGGEIYNFHTTKYPASYRTLAFYMNNDYDQASWAEISYINVEDKSSSVKIKSHISGDTLEEGKDITLTADAGAADGEKKNVDFYVNGVKIGSDTDQGKIVTETPNTGGGGCEGNSGTTTTTEPAKDATITLKAPKAGVYTVKAVCDGVESSEVTLFVKNNFSASLSVPKEVSSGEDAIFSISATDSTAVSEVEYFVNGEYVAESNQSDSFSVSVSNLPIGTASVVAKVFSADGTYVYTEPKAVKVLASDVENVSFSREYQIDYTVSDGGSVNIKDGYFELDINHSGTSVSYKDEKGAIKTYSGTLGAGNYRIVVTAGNAEVYYNGQFAFAFLMPNSDVAQNISYSGVENFVFGGSGVKQTFVHENWNGENEISEVLPEIGHYYSIEFDKKDSSSETVKLYDGNYEIYVTMDESGIVVNRQPTVGAPTEKYKIADAFDAGYYRITVAEGMSQIFWNNKVLGTWRAPLYSGRAALYRTVSNPSATTFVAIKATDDVYYHSEDFEGNIEEDFNADDYWFDETDARIESEEVEAAYNHEIVTEDGNSYLKMTGAGTYFLNTISYNPTFKWKGYFDGSDGDFAVRFRDSIKFNYCEMGYDAANGQWFAKNSSRKYTEIKDTEDSDGDGNTTEVIDSYYESSFTDLGTATGTLDTGWHEYEMIFEGAKVTLLCDGVAVISGDGFRNSFGKIGFRIGGSGSLGIDDVEYSGEGKATANFSYMNDGRSGFYRNFKGQIIAASPSSGYSWYTSEDNGVTWNETLNSSEDYIGSRSANNLMLQSGKFLRARYGNAKYSYAYLYDENSYVNRNSRANGTEYTPGTEYAAQIEAPGSMENVPYSGMPSRLMQIQSGPYKGRVIYCRGGSGEIYGRTMLYWSDDYDGVDDPAGKDAKWYEAEFQLSYFNTGHNIQESLVVDMPDGTLRYYVRTEMGHLGYFTSSDGGETWDKPLEMKTENLISPLCCFSIQRKGDTSTYYAFFEYDVITANLTYLESPRNRRALAVSYDGMETWEYVADIEEEGRSANSSSNTCNHGMRYIDGAVYMGYSSDTGYNKMFRVDETKMKPLKRFTSLHYRSQEYVSVSDMRDQNCIIPKVTGDAYIYGRNVYTEVNQSGFAKAEVVAMAVGAAYSQNGENATLTLGDMTVTFTNGQAYYAVDGDKLNTHEVCYEDGYLNPEIVAELFSKTVYEDENNYIISQVKLNSNITNQLAAVESGENAAEVMNERFLAKVNAASQSNDGSGILAAIVKYPDAVGFIPDTSTVKDAIAVFDRMTGIEYQSAEDVESVFKIALKAQEEYESKEQSNIIISTFSEGFADWYLVSRNQGTVTVEGDVASLDIKKGDNAKFSYGTPGLDITKDSFAFSFDYEIVEGTSDGLVKIGNGRHMIEVRINSSKIKVDLGKSVVEQEFAFESGKKYTFTGRLIQTSDGKKLSLSVTDGADVNIILCENAAFTYEGVLRGVWFEADGKDNLKVKLSGVRIHKGRAVDVISYTAEDGLASATVDFLNFDKVIYGSSVESSDAVWVNHDFEGEVDFNDGVYFSRSGSSSTNYTVDVQDGAMHFYKSLDEENSIEQRIHIPTVDSLNPGNDIIYEYDLMIPDPNVWTQTQDTAFLYYDIYVNHPVKAMRQTMYIQKNCIKVGGVRYYFKDICGTPNYDGIWMSFKHHYYFENGEWKCKFYYKKQSDDQWISGTSGMNSSTNKQTLVRFYAYPEDQVEICVDNIKIRNVGEDVFSNQLIIGLYDDEGRQLGAGHSEAMTETVKPYAVKRYNLTGINYNSQDGNTPEARFFIWNCLGEMIPIMEITKTK